MGEKGFLQNLVKISKRVGELTGKLNVNNSCYIIVMRFFYFFVKTPGINISVSIPVIPTAPSPILGCRRQANPCHPLIVQPRAMS
jgi:hypothetical protein